MKKEIFTLLLLLFAGAALWGQHRSGGQLRETRPWRPQVTEDIRFRSVLDTLLPAAFEDTCSLTAVSYEVEEEWGFVAGMNGYGDQEKAQLFRLDEGDEDGQAALLGAWVFFDVATVVGNGYWRVKVYRVDESDGGPGELLGMSDSLRVTDIDTDPEEVIPTVITFDEPITVGDSFFVSVDLAGLYRTEDTVGIFQTRDSCGDGSDAWELFSDGESWLPIDDDEFSWGIESNFFIFALVETDVTAPVRQPVANGLRLLPAYPNPAADEVQLGYELDRTATNVQIEIYSPTGQILRRFDRGQLPAGPHVERLASGTLPPGAYSYSIITNEARLTGRFVIR